MLACRAVEKLVTAKAQKTQYRAERKQKLEATALGRLQWVPPSTCLSAATRIATKEVTVEPIEEVTLLAWQQSSVAGACRLRGDMLVGRTSIR